MAGPRTMARAIANRLNKERQEASRAAGIRRSQLDRQYADLIEGIPQETFDRITDFFLSRVKLIKNNISSRQDTLERLAACLLTDDQSAQYPLAGPYGPFRMTLKGIDMSEMPADLADTWDKLVALGIELRKANSEAYRLQCGNIEEKDILDEVVEQIAFEDAKGAELTNALLAKIRQAYKIPAALPAPAKEVDAEVVSE